MAEKGEEYPLETQQEHALMCEKHDLMPVDIICEDCDKFICSKCVKEDHKEHCWDTLSTASTLKRRGLLKSMKKIEKEDIRRLENDIEKASRQIDLNMKTREKTILQLHNHYDTIVERLDKIREKREKTIKDSLESQNAEIIRVKRNLEKAKKDILRLVKSLKENGDTMTDMILLKTHKDLTKRLSTEDGSIEKYLYSLEYEHECINEDILEIIMGNICKSPKITVTETDSFQWDEHAIQVLEAMDDDTCFLSNVYNVNVEQVNKSGESGMALSMNINDVCVTDKKVIYISDLISKSVFKLSQTGSVSTVFSTDPLEPVGVCQALDDQLLVTLSDTESAYYELDSRSKRLVRHVTLTGDVILEYTYQEKGQIKQFTWPFRVTQNGNSDVCLLNNVSKSNGELLIFSFSGFLKSAYRGRLEPGGFLPEDVVCDSFFSIVVCESQSSTVHLLSPAGKFLRYLLTEKQVNQPTAMSLKKSTLWIGDNHGLVKVFKYKS